MYHFVLRTPLVISLHPCNPIQSDPTKLVAPGEVKCLRARSEIVRHTDIDYVDVSPIS